MFKNDVRNKQWNILYYLSTFIGIALYFITLAVVSNLIRIDAEMYGAINYTFKTPIVWLILLLQIVIGLCLGMLYNLYLRERNADLSQVLWEAEKFGYLTKNGKHPPTNDIIAEYLQR